MATLMLGVLTADCRPFILNRMEREEMIAKHRVPTTVTEALAVLQAMAKPATVAEALAKFEEAGIVRRTGEFQRGSITAELQPVYTLTELGKKLEPNLWPEGKQ